MRVKTKASGVLGEPKNVRVIHEGPIETLLPWLESAKGEMRIILVCGISHPLSARLGMKERDGGEGEGAGGERGAEREGGRGR